MLDEIFGENASTAGIIGTTVCLVLFMLLCAQGVAEDRENRQDLKMQDKIIERLLVEECSGEEHVKDCIKKLKDALD